MRQLDDGLVRQRLDNGLQVLVQRLSTAPLVSVWCWYHVGSKNECAGTTGISHFVEHMNFKGTSGISREQLKVWIERAGGFWNGYTWIDQTAYYETLAADEVDLALRIESERMDACLYDAEEFESERTVVLAELQGNRNSPEYLLDLDVTAAAMRMHPYRWPTIGWQSDLESMTRDDLLRHYRDWYVPANATLVVVGDVDPHRALEAVERRFGDKTAAAPPARPAVVEPAQEGERRVVVERQGNTAYLQVVFPAPAFTHPDFVPLLVADAALSGGKGVNLQGGGLGRGARVTSPLYGALVEPELVVSVGSSVLPTEQPYLYGISATLRDGVDHRRTEDALFGTLARMAAEPLSESALERARKQVLSALAFETERVTEIGHQLGYFNTIASIEAWLAVSAAVQAVTAADVQQVASRIWRPDQRTIGWFVPRRTP